MPSSSQSALAQRLGLRPPGDAPWGFHVSWATTDPGDWVLRRNCLKPDGLRFTLSLNQSYWKAVLERRDGLYEAIWGAGTPRPVVETDAMRYRVSTAWPPLATPGGAAGVVRDLPALLSREFQREVNLDGSLVDQVLDGGFNDGSLRSWLRPSADGWQVFGKRRPGETSSKP